MKGKNKVKYKSAAMDASRCIHCKKCTESCVFLKKYDIDIGNVEELEQLAYHCFLCGKCSRVCPEGIDGREIILNIRKEKVKQNQGRLEEKGYGFVIKEKEKYLFQNYRNIKEGSVLFPGCNFPSFYPATTRLVYEMLNEKQPTGLVFDCCGKPIEELGKSREAEKIIQNMNTRFQDAKVTEVIMVCPNCYYFLKPRLNVKVISIYEKLQELGLGKKLEENQIHIFTPCPDRESGEWIRHMAEFLPEQWTNIDEVQCCGLGGCAGVKEPELAKGLLQGIKEKEYRDIYTYCGTCGGNMTRAGCTNIHHILAEITGSKEQADAKRSLLNRARTKFVTV
ncbi:MAG: (Fe-S)-binding protein [Muricomes sp.]